MEHWHRKEKKKAVLSDQPIEYAEKAILEYSVEEIAEGKFLWLIELYTGKYHQIRAQLASLGCPISGDGLYGSQEEYLQDSIALHAYLLEFLHPVSGEKMVISAPSPFCV